jgi:hypothetical protein
MKALLAVLAGAGALVLAAGGAAQHNADEHSENMRHVARFTDGGAYASGTDIAFWGDIAVAGNQSPGGFRLIQLPNARDRAPVLTELAQFSCNGGQSDVSIWKTLAFVSIDGPRTSEACDAGSASQGFEGIRVVDLGSLDAPTPTQVAFVRTDCGSHTHTLVPDEANERVLIYVLSYPLGLQTESCNVLTHRKISVVEVPLAAPAAARVVSTPDVSPAIGCHDVTVLVPRKLAGAACITESQLWDISDPEHPRVVSHIVNPAINIHHSTTFSFDGNTLAIGDELGGAAVAPGCLDGNEHLPIGAIWFYDVSNPALPLPKGTFSIPQQVTSTLCTAHNFNTVPVRSERDLLVSAWYRGGTTVVDFTDPANPQQVGYYIVQSTTASNAWSSYWYRDQIFANNLGTAGFDAFTLHELADDAVRLGHLNPQTMETLRGRPPR